MTKKIISAILLMLLMGSCSISYKFDGSHINYDVVKTIAIKDFPNQASLVYPTLTQILGESLRNKFITNTRLRSVDNNADLELEGEITGYDIMGLDIKQDAYASQTRLTITLKVRFTNNKNPNEDVEQTFSGSKEFSSNEMLDSVQDRLVKEIVSDLTDQIYNATLGNW